MTFMNLILQKEGSWKEKLLELQAFDSLCTNGAQNLVLEHFSVLAKIIILFSF